MKKLRIMALGACQLQDPIYNLDARGIARHVWHDTGADQGMYTHSVQESYQLMQYCRCDLVIPKDILPLCYFYQGFDPKKLTGTAVDSADVTLVQIESSLEFTYGPYRINRNEIGRQIYPVAYGHSERARDLCNNWGNALIKANDEVRRKYAGQLLELLPDNAEYQWLRAAFGAIGSFKESQEGLTARLTVLLKTIRNPVGLVTPAVRYMPDGRPLYWPPEFIDDLKLSAQQCGVPFFDAAAIVEARGMNVAIAEDAMHWRREFLPIVGEYYLEFCHKLFTDGTT